MSIEDRDNIITTDIRVELISTVIYLSGLQNEGIVVSSDDLCSDAIDKRFAEFINHPAVTMYPELWEMGLWWGEIPRLALHLSDDITLQNDYWLSNEPDFWPSEEKPMIIEFVKQLKDFFNQSDFRQFYTDNLPENDEFINLLSSLLAEYPLQEILEDYLGQQIGTTHIILMNLIKTSIGVWTGDYQSKQVYCFCSRHWLMMGRKNNCLQINFYNTVWHEFLHSVINPLTDQLFPGGITATEEQSIWYCALNESILWALTHRLCRQIGIVSDSDNGWYFNNARRNKAPKAEELYALLVNYEAQRHNYKSIADFYPVLQAAFGNPPR